VVSLVGVDCYSCGHFRWIVDHGAQVRAHNQSLRSAVRGVNRGISAAPDALRSQARSVLSLCSLFAFRVRDVCAGFASEGSAIWLIDALFAVAVWRHGLFVFSP
jgi:hypothetical protein